MENHKISFPTDCPITMQSTLTILSLLILCAFSQESSTFSKFIGNTVLDNANTKDARIFFPESGASLTLYGRTMTVDTGSRQRIVDVAGQIDLTSGNLMKSITFYACLSGEGTIDGISGYDFKTNTIYFADDGAFGGAVFYANMTDYTIQPPTSYYLSPVAFLGYDPVTSSRIIVGENTPGKNFLIMDKPYFGEVTLYPVPSTIRVTGNDAYDGNSKNYYSVQYQGSTGSLLAWNIGANTTSTFTLSCLSAGSFFDGPIFINPTNPNILIGITFTPATDAYGLTTINLQQKSCTVVGPFPSLPPTPRIIVASDIGNISGNIVISVTSNVGNFINVYDQTTKLVATVKTTQLFEDIFAHESA